MDKITHLPLSAVLVFCCAGAAFANDIDRQCFSSPHGTACFVATGRGVDDAGLKVFLPKLKRTHSLDYQPYMVFFAQDERTLETCWSPDKRGLIFFSARPSRGTVVVAPLILDLPSGDLYDGEGTRIVSSESLSRFPPQQDIRWIPGKPHSWGYWDDGQKKFLHKTPVIQGCFILALHWMQMRIESGKSLIAC